MSDDPHGAPPATRTQGPQAPARRRTLIGVLAVAVGLLMFSCVTTVFLVLTGIIAEPVTVIEDILRVIHALVGG